ncbi:hypothetical protein [Chondromyces crocatus]|uniref:STAS/SEC14 domain-containing protein n=1 Tax=Chondromyces crocatus TaxID=52 RepID=A0A0K1EKG9_CHOCO|nr:hypothetical protein [Chondromyces crocatus]AKT41364.1 uncharacterized protein CMC5_055640 [Chondromyces crocatus]
MSLLTDEPRTVGAHSIAFEPPCLAIVRLKGRLREEEIRRLREHMNAGASRQPFTLFLLDLSAAGEVTPGARRYIAHGPLKTPYRGMALFHGSFHARLMAKLLIGALNTFTKLRDNPVALFGSEKDARAWLLERHRKLLHAASPPAVV